MLEEALFSHEAGWGDFVLVRQVVGTGSVLSGDGVYDEEGLYIKFLSLPTASSYHEGGVI